MIRLAFVSDKNDIVGGSTAAIRAQRESQRPNGLDTEIAKLFFDQNAIVGSVTYEHSIALFSTLDPGEHDLFVLSRNQNFDLRGNAKATVVTELSAVVDRFKGTQERLVVGGGVAVWKAFLPFADEIVIARCDQPRTGDLFFSDWRDASFVERKRHLWDGGVTLWLDRVADGVS